MLYTGHTTRTFDDDDEVRDAICELVPFLEMNAREIKRFINLFRLNILIVNRRGLLEQGVVEIAQLARCNAIVAHWPDFVDWGTDQAFLKDCPKLRSFGRPPTKLRMLKLRSMPLRFWRHT